MANTIDLEAPGHLYASAKNAKDYTFFVMLKNPKYTKDALAANPNCVTAKDLLFKSSPVPDTNGQVSCDLAPKAKDIIKKLKDKKLPSDYKGMVAVVTTSKPENKDPSKKEADVKEFTLKRKAEEIKLKGIRPIAKSHHWVAYHHPICYVEMEVVGDIKEVECTYGKCGRHTAMFASWEQAQPGTHKCKKVVLGSCGDWCGGKCGNSKGHHRGGWWGSVKGWAQGKVKMPVKEGVKYVIGIYPRDSGTTTLTVKGTGQFSKLQQKITVGMSGRHPHPGD